MSCIEIGLRTQKTDNNPYGYAKVNNIPADEVCVLYFFGGTEQAIMKAGEKFIIKSGAKDEKSRMLINFPAFIRTCFGFRQFNRSYEYQDLYLS